MKRQGEFGLVAFALGVLWLNPRAGEPATREQVNTDSPQTLSNKTLVSPVLQGNIGIGITDPNLPVHVFTTRDNIHTGMFETDQPYTRIGIKSSLGQWDIISGVDQANKLVFHNPGGASYALTILGNGNVNIGSRRFANYRLELDGCSSGGCAGKPDGTASTSDARLKDIKGPYEYGLRQVGHLNPVRFAYKDGNALGLPSEQTMVGFSAQEVREVIPEAVFEGPDGYLRFNADPVFWAMLNAIKELDAKVAERPAPRSEDLLQMIQEQRAQIEALKAEVAALRHQGDR